MIDARNELMTPAPAKRQTERAKLTAKRGRLPGSNRRSLPVARVFSDSKVSPFDQIEWDRRTAEITDDGGGFAPDDAWGD